jgi:tetratricopeptide (TPR) repeat protein
MLPDKTETLRRLWATALSHFQAGRLAEAEADYRQFIALAPDHPGASYNLAVVVKSLGRSEEAAVLYRRVLALQPANAKAHNNLGVILAAQGKTDEALAHYQRALAIQPEFADAHFNLGDALRAAGRPRDAIAHYRRALAAGDDPEILNNLGIALAADGQAEAAVQQYRRALMLRPDYAQACSNLGSALADLGRADEATAQYRKALQLKPDYADAHFNLAHALDEQERTDEALAHYEQALALDPGHAEAQHNFGFLLQRLGRVDEALARFERALALKPDYGDAQWNEALARLVVGDFETGWRKYEARLSRKDFQPRALPAPLWDGGDFSGRTLLLHAEQGLGDAIQFVRYAPMAKARGGTVMLEVQPSQMRLFQGLPGVDRLIAAGSPLPRFDVHAPLLSLPGLMDTRLDTIPAEVPYLEADPELAAVWRARLAGLTRRRIGFLWRGNPNHANDRRRSMPAAAMAQLVGSVDADWVCLQIDARPDELAQFPGVFQAGPLIGDWADTAAVVNALDLVVTVDTSIAHLAGALGKPVWMLIPFAPDWRWLLHRADSPWYPSMRIWRQPAPGDWSSVTAGVAAALQHFPTEHAPPPAPAVLARRLPPAMVVSHERSGTHFLMNALSYAYGYTAQPWMDLDAHDIAADYADPGQIADALAARAGDPLLRLVKSHHEAAVFGTALDRIAGDYRIFYIHRDPAAVMTSFWRHLNGLGWNEGPKTEGPLALARAAPSGALTRYQAAAYPTMLRRWAGHVEGWLAAATADPRITVVNYADLDARYEQTVRGFETVVGRAPLQPMLRPPRDVNVIAMGKTAAEAPVSPATAEALRQYCREEVGELLGRLSR